MVKQKGEISLIGTVMCSITFLTPTAQKQTEGPWNHWANTRVSHSPPSGLLQAIMPLTMILIHPLHNQMGQSWSQITKLTNLYFNLLMDPRMLGPTRIVLGDKQDERRGRTFTGLNPDFTLSKARKHHNQNDYVKVSIQKR